MMLEKIKSFPIILGSQSPRRHELLKSLDLDFEVIIKSIDETVPSNILPEAAAEYVALKKLEAFKTPEFENHIVITADTVVVDHLGRVLGKPIDAEHANLMLQDLNGNVHRVFTAVGILMNEELFSFTCETEVQFSKLTQSEIDYYIHKYRPYDKAGSYGIQEWIGRIAVERINGSYENVMGLPTHRLYKELSKIEKGL